MEETPKMELRKMSNTQISNIISFVAGFMQSITFILSFTVWKYFSVLTRSQNLILVAIIIINEVLVYVLMRMSSVITKQK